MVQKIHPWGVIWVQNNRPQVSLVRKENDDLAVKARTYLQLHYGNGFFGNVYLTAEQH